MQPPPTPIIRSMNSVSSWLTTINHIRVFSVNAICSHCITKVHHRFDPYLLNPMTGIQGALPPVNTITVRGDNFYDDEGKHVLDLECSEYARVAIAPATEVAECTVLIVHVTGSITTLNLKNASSPSATKVIMRNVTRGSVANMYLVVTPSGQLLQVWRMLDNIDVPLKNHCVDLANENGSDDNFSETVTDDQRQMDVEEEEEELRDDEVNTTKVLIFKVDTSRQKLVDILDIGDYTIFLGFNVVVCLSAKDTTLEPNCIYLTDEVCSPSYHPMLGKHVGIWNIKKRSMQKLGDVWPLMHSWLDLPAPIWITPS
ncbi:hypothetical protein ZWY2020_013489 [Hordeum vulgare]|nr:hypothetical protein ZWY2020_013489 [Hordeum vulgare]